MEIFVLCFFSMIGIIFIIAGIGSNNMVALFLGFAIVGFCLLLIICESSGVRLIRYE